jgi:hypothetical protein
MALFQGLNYVIIKVITIIIHVILIVVPFRNNDGQMKPSPKKWTRKIFKKVQGAIYGPVVDLASDRS